MDMFVWSTIGLSIWGAVAPVLAVKYGQDLNERWHKNHSLGENKKQKWRDVVSQLENCYRETLFHEVRRETEKKDKYFVADNTARSYAQIDALISLKNRLYVSDEIQKHDLIKKWTALVTGINDTHNLETFTEEYRKINAEILDMARTS